MPFAYPIDTLYSLYSLSGFRMAVNVLAGASFSEGNLSIMTIFVLERTLQSSYILSIEPRRFLKGGQRSPS